MNLRICLNCGYIWDRQAEEQTYCYICRVNNQLYTTNTADLGTTILELRRSNLIHHGKLKGLK